MQKPIIPIVQILTSCLIVVLIGSSGRLYGEEQVRRDFEVENARLREVGQKLTDSYNASVCIEEARMFAVEGDSEERVRELEERRNRGITLKSKNATLREVLDKLVEDEPAYTWRFDEKTRHFNIFPKEDAPLGWKIGSVEFRDKTLYEALLDEDVLGLGKHDTHYLPPFSSNGWDGWEMSFKAADITAREALNGICAEYAKKLDREVTWSLSETGKDGLFRKRFVTLRPSRCSQPSEIRIGPIITDFKTENERLPKIAEELTHSFRACVCVETQPIFAGDDIPDKMIAKWNETLGRKISFELKQGSLQEALDKLAEAAPLYTWELDEETGIFNVFPKEHAPLEWTIEKIDFEDKTLYEVLKGEDLLGLEKHGIECMLPRATGPVWAMKKVSLKAEDMTARKVLNRLCVLCADDSRACGGLRRARWELSALVTHGVWTGPLRFHGVVLLPE